MSGWHAVGLLMTSKATEFAAAVTPGGAVAQLPFMSH